MHDPRDIHFSVVKHILRYLHLIIHHPLTSYVLLLYIGAEWAGCPDTRKTTSGYDVFLGDNLISCVPW